MPCSVMAAASLRSTVHRPTPLDAIAIKKFDDKGNVTGERIFVGLFTSNAYSMSPRRIPVLRRKVDEVVAQSGFDPRSHSGKALLIKTPWELFNDYFERITPNRDQGEFWVTTGRINEIWQSGFDDIRKPYTDNRWPDTFAEINPTDAAEYGIESGDEIRMYSEPENGAILTVRNAEQADMWREDGTHEHVGCCTVQDLGDDEETDYALWAGTLDSSGTYYIVVEPAKDVVGPVSYMFTIEGEGPSY